MYYYTTKEVANLLRVSKDSVYRWIQSGKLPAVKITRGTPTDRSMQIDEEDLKAFIESHTRQGGKAKVSEINIEKMALKKYYTPKEIAKLLNVTSGHVRRLILRGELAAFKVDKKRCVRIDSEDLDEFIEAHTFQRKRS